MKSSSLGIWLDRRQAYLVWTGDDGAVDLRHAEAEYHERRERPGHMLAGRTGVHGALAGHARHEQKRRREARLFYERIIRTIWSAQNVYIFGPGQAKSEFRSMLARHKGFAGRVLAVESAERMTPGQMTAQVRKFFKVPKTAA